MIKKAINWFIVFALLFLLALFAGYLTKFYHIPFWAEFIILFQGVTTIIYGRTLLGND